MPHVFLSYNREDQGIAKRYVEALEADGVSVWWDTTLRAGENYDAVTEQALRDAKAVVVLWSKRSVQSRWVRSEATLALRANTLAPVMIEACERPIMFELTQTADLSHWRGDREDPVWRAFVADVKAMLEGRAPERRPIPAAPKKASWRRFAERAVVSIKARPRIVLGCIACVAALALAVGRFTAPPAATPILAVLPFDNLSGDASFSYVSDGLATEIQSTLARVPSGMRVLGTASSFRFRGGDKDAANVRAKLPATHLVDGSVRREGDRLRVVAQLLDAKTGATLWSASYDRAFKDFLETENDIAREIGYILGVAEPHLQRPGKIDQAALDHYLHGLVFFDSLSPGDAEQAVAELEEATRLSPEFANAWALLGLSYTKRSRYQEEAEQAASIAKARTAAERAKRLDPNSPIAEVLLARIEPEWSWEAKSNHIQKALRLAPNNAIVLTYYSDLLMKTGRRAAARDVSHQAYALDPLSDEAVFTQFHDVVKSGDAEKAISYAEHYCAIDPKYAGLWGDMASMYADREPTPENAKIAERALGEFERRWEAFATAWGQPPDKIKEGPTDLRLAVEKFKQATASGVKPDWDKIWIPRSRATFERLQGPRKGQGCATGALPSIAHDLPDLAWKVADALYLDKGFVGTKATCQRPVYNERQAATLALFDDDTANMRKDPRIWRIFHAVGLASFWRAHDVWPDFCAEPGLPYDCKAMARTPPPKP